MIIIPGPKFEKMKKYLILVILGIVILAGFLARDQFLTINVYDTYYLINYLHFSLVITALILLGYLVLRFFSHKKS